MIIFKARNIAAIVSLSIILSGCNGKVQKGGGPAKKSEAAEPAQQQKSVSSSDAAVSELTQEFNAHGNGQFSIQLLSDQPSSSEVVLNVVIECQLGWQQTDIGFRPMRGKDAGGEIVLVNGEGSVLSAAKLENPDLATISLKGRFVRRSDEEGKLISEGDQRLLDYLGWPEGMRIAEFSNTPDSLVVRSKKYRITLQQRDKTEDGYHWEVTSVNPIEGDN